LSELSFAVPAPLAGNVFNVLVKVGDVIAQGDVILILEAMKMETEIRSPSQGIVQSVNFQAGDAVKVGDDLITLS
jgi:oxaloacetate decarboxylase alpha subunit